MSDLIKEAQALCDKATKGPWKVNTDCFVRTQTCETICMCGEDVNADFIARARTLVPELVVFLEAVTKSSDDLCQQLTVMTARAEGAEYLVEFWRETAKRHEEYADRLGEQILLRKKR